MLRPAAMATALVSPTTVTGVRRRVVVPSPSWPSALSPHVRTVPSARSAREWLCPVSTAMTPVEPGDLGRGRAVGRRAEAELALLVAAPHPDGAVAAQRGDVLATAVQVDHVVRARRPGRASASPASCRAELPEAVPAPRPGGPGCDGSGAAPAAGAGDADRRWRAGCADRGDEQCDQGAERQGAGAKESHGGPLPVGGVGDTSLGWCARAPHRPDWGAGRIASRVPPASSRRGRRSATVAASSARGRAGLTAAGGSRGGVDVRGAAARAAGRRRAVAGGAARGRGWAPTGCPHWRWAPSRDPYPPTVRAPGRRPRGVRRPAVRTAYRSPVRSACPSLRRLCPARHVPESGGSP